MADGLLFFELACLFSVLDSRVTRQCSVIEMEDEKSMITLWPNKSLEPTAAPLSGLARLPFRVAGSSGCGSALIR
jgi:hypothetical protein